MDVLNLNSMTYRFMCKKTNLRRKSLHHFTFPLEYLITYLIFILLVYYYSDTVGHRLI